MRLNLFSFNLGDSKYTIGIGGRIQDSVGYKVCQWTLFALAGLVATATADTVYVTTNKNEMAEANFDDFHSSSEDLFLDGAKYLGTVSPFGSLGPNATAVDTICDTKGTLTLAFNNKNNSKYFVEGMYALANAACDAENDIYRRRGKILVVGMGSYFCGVILSGVTYSLVKWKVAPHYDSNNSFTIGGTMGSSVVLFTTSLLTAGLLDVDVVTAGGVNFAAGVLCMTVPAIDLYRHLRQTSREERQSLTANVPRGSQYLSGQDLELTEIASGSHASTHQFGG